VSYQITIVNGLMKVEPFTFSELTPLRQFVGGFIEMVGVHLDDGGVIIMICNEDGVRLSLPVNFYFPYVQQPILGPCRIRNESR